MNSPEISQYGILIRLICTWGYFIHRAYYYISRGPGHEIHALVAGVGEPLAQPAPSRSPGALGGCPTDSSWLFPMRSRSKQSVRHLNAAAEARKAPTTAVALSCHESSLWAFS